MYNYGPGQENSEGQVPNQPPNPPYGGQPQYPSDPNAYPQQPPPMSPSPYEQPGIVSGPPAPQFGAAPPVSGFPAGPPTGMMDQTMMGGPPMMMAPAQKKSQGLIIGLASVAVLLLVASVIFMVLWINASGDLETANGKVKDRDSEISRLEDDNEDLEECQKAAQEFFENSGSFSDIAEACDAEY